ncbi:MAG: hypothetical protein ABIE22_01095 [archaeon]
MEKQIINVTDISEYLFCPMKVYLRLVKKIRFPPNKPMISGQLKHKVFDLFNKNDPAIVSSINSSLSEKRSAKIIQNRTVKNDARSTDD